MKFKNKYKWYRNPIKWYTYRKCVAFLNLWAKTKQAKDMEADVIQMETDMFLYGCALSKNGKRVDPTVLWE